MIQGVFLSDHVNELLRSGWQEEWAARPAAEMLLDFAHGTIVGDHAAGGQSKDRAQDTGRPEHPDTRIPDSKEGDRCTPSGSP